ncbi:MAG: hypothetical protein JO138_19675 [Acidobacteriaceae bacterium]|nr:hypothetical protein [Acidobacteriaceae bacterium]
MGRVHTQEWVRVNPSTLLVRHYPGIFASIGKERPFRSTDRMNATWKAASVI